MVINIKLVVFNKDSMVISGEKWCLVVPKRDSLVFSGG